VLGVAGDDDAPTLILGLRYPDGRLHHLGRLGGVICHLQPNRRAGRRFVSTQAAGEALLGDGPYPADVRPLPNAEYVR
jgi:hypothetical protein